MTPASVVTIMLPTALSPLPTHAVEVVPVGDSFVVRVTTPEGSHRLLTLLPVKGRLAMHIASGIKDDAVRTDEHGHIQYVKDIDENTCC